VGINDSLADGISTEESGQQDAEPSAGDVRNYLVAELNATLRWPGMYGGEMAMRLYLDAVAFAHGCPQVMLNEMGAALLR